MSLSLSLSLSLSCMCLQVGRQAAGDCVRDYCEYAYITTQYTPTLLHNVYTGRPRMQVRRPAAGDCVHRHRDAGGQDRGAHGRVPPYRSRNGLVGGVCVCVCVYVCVWTHLIRTRRRWYASPKWTK